MAIRYRYQKGYRKVNVHLGTIKNFMDEQSELIVIAGIKPIFDKKFNNELTQVRCMINCSHILDTNSE